jgi:hypothetical protein
MLLLDNLLPEEIIHFSSMVTEMAVSKIHLCYSERAKDWRGVEYTYERP